MERQSDEATLNVDGYSTKGFDEFEAAARELRALQGKVAGYGSAATILGEISSSLGSIGGELKSLPLRLQHAVDQNSSAIDEVRLLQGSLGEKALAFDQVATRLSHFDFATPIAELQRSASAIDIKLIAIFKKLDQRLQQIETTAREVQATEKRVETRLEEQTALLRALDDRLADGGRKGLWERIAGK